MATIPKKKTMRELMDDDKSARGNDVAVLLPRLGDYEDCPAFPDDLTLMSSRELGTLYSTYIGFLAYLTEVLASHKYEYDLRKSSSKQQRAAVAYSSRGIKLQKWASVYCNLDVQAGLKRLAHAKALVTAYSGMLWTLKDFLRGLEFERDRRTQASRTGEMD